MRGQQNEKKLKNPKFLNDSFLRAMYFKRKKKICPYSDQTKASKTEIRLHHAKKKGFLKPKVCSNTTF